MKYTGVRKSKEGREDAYNSENSDTRFCVAGSSDTDRVSVRTVPAVGIDKCWLAYLIGSLTIWALFYGLARIALDGKWTLTKLTKVFCVLLAVLTILSTGVIIYRWHMRELIRIKSRTSLLFTAVAAVLILAVAGGFAANRTDEHTVEQVMTMYMTDLLYESTTP